MSLTSSTPDSAGGSANASSVPRWVLFACVILFLLVGYLLYASYTTRQNLTSELTKSHQQEQVLTAELDKTNARVADLTGRLDVTIQKLNLSEDELARARSLTQQVRKQQQASDQQIRQQMGQMQEETSTKLGQLGTDLSGAKTDIASTKTDLETTKNLLQSVKGDLGVQSGLVARNHDELEQLKRLGERNYFEFNLTKTKTPQRVGPIMIQLKKTDTKRYKYTMNVIADDKTIEKKDKTADEPVQFYVRGAHIPYEIVVFEVGKNKITGYLSTPKDTTPPPSGSGSPN